MADHLNDKKVIGLSCNGVSISCDEDLKSLNDGDKIFVEYLLIMNGTITADIN